MRRLSVLLAFALSLTLLSGPVRASLFEDDFDGTAGGTALDDTPKWQARSTSTETEAVVAAPTADHYGSYNFSASAANDDTTRAWTEQTWSIATDGPLVWTIDFRIVSGVDTTTVVPFVFDTDLDDEDAGSNKFWKDTEVSVHVLYDASDASDSVANLNLDGVAWTVFEDDLGNNFQPIMTDTTWYRLTMTLDATDASGSIRAASGGGTVWSASASLSNTDLTAVDQAYAGMQVHNTNAGGQAKEIAFDNISLTPEPATLALVGLGGAGLLWTRRRR